MFKHLKEQFKNEKGLTLVELLAVIIILAIISVIGFVFISGIIDNSKKDAHIANAVQLIAAAKYYDISEDMDNEGENPVKKTDLENGQYIEEKVLDPWEKESYDNDAQIHKEKGVFWIEFDANTEKGEDSKCTIKATENDLAKDSRDDLCEGEGSTDKISSEGE